MAAMYSALDSPESWELAEVQRTVAPSTVDIVLARQAALELQRAAAEQHHHKQVWTKEPHGGHYIKVVPKELAGGSGALQLPNPALRQPLEPGYEVVNVGPTTNFVGNAMTRGAEDLVMAELEVAHHMSRAHTLPAALLSPKAPLLAAPPSSASASATETPREVARPAASAAFLIIADDSPLYDNSPPTAAIAAAPPVAVQADGGVTATPAFSTPDISCCASYSRSYSADAVGAHVGLLSGDGMELWHSSSCGSSGSSGPGPAKPNQTRDLAYLRREARRMLGRLTGSMRA